MEFEQQAITGVSTTVSQPTPRADALAEEHYRDSLDFTNKATSFFDVAKNANWVYNLSQVERFEPEDNYSVGFDTAKMILDQNELIADTENLSRLTESVSSKETDYQIEVMLRKKKETQQAQKNLSSGWKTAAQITGVAASPEVIGTIGLGIAFKATTIPRILATSSAVESVSTVGKFATDYTYTMEDAFVDNALTTIFDLGAIKMLGKTQKSTEIETSDIKAPTENTLALEYKTNKEEQNPSDVFFSAYQKERDNLKVEEAELQKAMDKDVEFMAWSKDNQRREAEIQKMIDNFDEEVKASQKAKKYYDELAKMRSDASQYRERIRQQELEKKEIALRNKMEEERMLHKFETDPKYANDVTKKIAKQGRERIKELDIQAKKVERANQKIDETKANIKSIEEKLSKVNSKIKARESETNLTKSKKATLNKWKKEADELRQSLGQEKNKIVNKVDANRINKERKELGRLNRIIDESFDDIKEAASVVSKQIRNMSKSELEEMKDSINLLAKNNEEFAKVKVDLENLLKPKGKYQGLSISKMSRKKKAIILGMAMTTPAFAGEDDEIIDLQTLALIAIALFAGYKGINAIGGLNEARAKLTKSLKDSEFKTSPKGTKIQVIKSKLHKFATTRFTETYEPIARHSDKAKDMIGRLVFNWDTGTMSAETRKMRYMHKALYDYQYKTQKLFKQWLTENNYGTSMKMTSNLELQNKFYTEVADYMEGNLRVSDSVKEAGEITKKVFDQAINDAKLAGVYGADAIKMIENYFPRMWRKDSIQQHIFKNPENKQILIDTLSMSMQKQGMSPDKALTKATEMSNWLTSKGRVGTSNYDDIFGKIDDLLKDTTTEEDIAKRLNEYKDRESRLKGRVDLDLEDLKNIKFKDEYGVEYTPDLDDMVKRNTLEVTESFLNSMYGATAMAEVGYKSRSQFLRAIEHPEIQGVSDEMEDISKLIYGLPLDNTNAKTLEMVNAARDLTIFAKLPFVAFSMIVEVVKALANGGLVASLRNAKHGLNFKRGDLLTETLIEAMPLGTSRTRNNFNVRAFDTGSSQDVADIGGKGMLSKASNTLKESTLLGSGMIHLSDFLHKWNLVNNATKFAKFIDTGKGLSPSRLKEYGIDSDTIEMFKDTFKFTDGKLDNFDFKSMPKAKQDKLSDILFRLNQEVSPEATTGGTPLWMKRDAVGKLVGTLGQYGANLFTAQGIRDVRHMDGMSIMNLLLTFTGAYMGMAAKNALLGREMDDETMLYYAMLSLPQAGMYGTGMTVMNPATVQLTKDVSEFLK